MSADTGEVLDYHVLSKACQKCALKKTQCGEDVDGFEEWRKEHLTSNECDINFWGSSPAMEAEGAIVMWKRSLRHITSGINGWCQMETAKPSIQLKMFTVNEKLRNWIV